MHDGMVHHNTCDTGPNSVCPAWSHFNLAVGGRHQRRDQVVHGGLSDGTHVRGRCDALQEERTGVEMVINIKLCLLSTLSDVAKEGAGGREQSAVNPGCNQEGRQKWG